MIISLSQLSVGYSLSHPVISDINLELRSGQLACLIGENGIGKSTLLKTLTGFLPKLKGSLLLDNRDIESFSQRELARQVSIVLTQKPDVQNLTIEEIIGLGRSPYTGFFGRLRAEDRQVVDDAIATMGIEKLRGRMIQTLSDGERQKVMIAKALAQETSIILLDEPTNSLDNTVESKLKANLKVNTVNKTMILVTHRTSMLDLVDRLIVMDNGKILLDGPRDEVLARLSGK